MASEVSRIEKWLYSKLSGDTGAGGVNTLVNGRIYAYLATQGAAYPLVLYSLQSDRDVQGVGTNRVKTNALYLIKVISKGAPTTAAHSAIDRIDELIGKAVRETSDGYVFTGRREESISYLETDETSQAGSAGSQFRHVGGLFRIEAYPA